MGKYFQEDIETMPQSEIKKIQEQGLKDVVKRVYENVPFYAKKMDEIGVTPDDIKSLDDITKLPFLTKDDLRDAYPFGLLARPLKDCVRIHSTSGTTGKRVVDFYTQKDLDMWSDCTARALVAAGATDEDVVHVCYGYGLFTGGSGLHDGSHKVGCLTLPMSSGNTDRQLQFMQDMGATILCCTPSYAAYLAESIEKRGIKGNLKLKAGIFGAEAWSEDMRHSIEGKLGIKAHDIYGLTEIEGPGVSFECEEQDGMHICEDYFIPEVVDPETLEPVPDGELGELVFTSFAKEAFPLIRYRTKDITYITHEKCKCGRTHARIHRLMGRTDDMLIIKGVNVYPSQVEEVLIKRGMEPNYQLIIDRIDNSDTLDVHVEKSGMLINSDYEVIKAKEREIVSGLKSMLGIYAKVTLVEPNSIPRSEGKAVRVIDNRKI
ncbi:MAG: phenylacetate--CoA ligase [Lachnospiraceae bacterium]|nr:phenylacetate--CoA ligase [Lachnospiraceae bacterium]